MMHTNQRIRPELLGWLLILAMAASGCGLSAELNSGGEEASDNGDLMTSDPNPSTGDDGEPVARAGGEPLPSGSSTPAYCRTATRMNDFDDDTPLLERVVVIEAFWLAVADEGPEQHQRIASDLAGAFRDLGEAVGELIEELQANPGPSLTNDEALNHPLVRPASRQVVVLVEDGREVGREIVDDCGRFLDRSELAGLEAYVSSGTDERLPLADDEDLDDSAGDGRTGGDIGSTSDETGSETPSASGAPTFGGVEMTVDGLVASSLNPNQFDVDDPDEGDGGMDWVYVAIELTNTDPNNEASILAGRYEMRTESGATSSGRFAPNAPTLKLAPGQAASRVLAFENPAGEGPDADRVVLIYRADDAIPVVLPLDGTNPDRSYPIPVDIDDFRYEAALSSRCSIESRVTIDQAAIAIDHPVEWDTSDVVGNRRARLDRRWLVVEGSARLVNGDCDAGAKASIRPDQFELQVDGLTLEPEISPFETVTAGTEEEVRIMFDIPADASSITLDVVGEDGGRTNIPIGLPSLPPAPGE